MYSLPSLNDSTVVSAVIQHHGCLCVGSMVRWLLALFTVLIREQVLRLDNVLFLLPNTVSDLSLSVPVSYLVG